MVRCDEWMRDARERAHFPILGNGIRLTQSRTPSRVLLIAQQLYGCTVGRSVDAARVGPARVSALRALRRARRACVWLASRLLLAVEGAHVAT